MAVRKGQSFIVGAVIFTAVIALAFTTTGPSLSDDGSTKFYFGQTLEKSASAANTALKNNKSIDSVKRSLYRYDNFLERRSKTRGITYISYSLFLLPEEGKGVFINRYGEELQPRILIDSNWQNFTVRSSENHRFSFTEYSRSYTLNFTDKEDSYRFYASTPKLLKKSVMESENERWENTLVG